MKKLAIFDLDGTLLNTVEDIKSVLNASLAKFHLPEITSEQTVKYLGNGAKKLVERAVAENKSRFEEVYAYYLKKFSECDNELTELYCGEERALRRLKECGVKLALVSNKPQKATEKAYNKFLCEFEFTQVLGQSDKYPLKPDPSSTLAVIEAAGVSKKDCVFIGDGETDVVTAKNAGIDCVSVLWGYRSKAQLAEAGAKVFAEDFDKLAEIILK